MLKGRTEDLLEKVERLEREWKASILKKEPPFVTSGSEPMEKKIKELEKLVLGLSTRVKRYDSLISSSNGLLKEKMEYLLEKITKLERELKMNTSKKNLPNTAGLNAVNNRIRELEKHFTSYISRLKDLEKIVSGLNSELKGYDSLNRDLISLKNTIVGLMNESQELRREIGMIKSFRMHSIPLASFEETSNRINQVEKELKKIRKSIDSELVIQPVIVE